MTDPDLGSDVLSAGVLEDVADGRTVTLGVELTGFGPATAEDLVERMRSAVLSLPGVEQVRVDDGARQDHPKAGTDTKSVGRQADRIVAVASAKGGVGKSTVATSPGPGTSVSSPLVLRPS